MKANIFAALYFNIAISLGMGWRLSYSEKNCEKQFDFKRPAYELNL